MMISHLKYIEDIKIQHPEVNDTYGYHPYSEIIFEPMSNFSDNSDYIFYVVNRCDPIDIQPKIVTEKLETDRVICAIKFIKTDIRISGSISAILIYINERII